MNFDQAFERVIGFEGGYSNDLRDPGGETNFGISKRAYPQEDIKNLTLQRAKDLYRRDYWGPAGCEAVPELVRFELFDMAVNAGVKSAIKALQKAVGADQDGGLGPNTLMRVQSADGAWVLRRLQAVRLDNYTRAAAWPTFGAGWVRRVAQNMMEA